MNTKEEQTTKITSSLRTYDIQHQIFMFLISQVIN